MAENGEQLSLTGELRSRGLERAYRLAQSSRERRQRRALWLVALLFYAGYGLLESSAAAAQWSGAWFMPRLGILLAGATALVLEPRLTEPAQRDWLACTSLLLAGLCYAILVCWRDSPDRSAGGLLLLVIGIYLFSPGRFVLTCITALGCSLFGGLALYAGSAGGAGAWVAYSYVLPGNLLAALSLVQLNRVRRLEFLQKERLRLARERNRDLLYRALPARIARQMLNQQRYPLAQAHSGAVVIFADLVGFSALSQRCSPINLVAYLDQLFSRFDHLAQGRCVEKIKTLGDAWMGVAGLDGGHGAGRDVANVLELALEMLQASAALPSPLGGTLQLRIGIHRGSLVAGVIGRQRYAFDVWGDTVNIASRLQGQAAPGQVLVSVACSQQSERGFRFGPEYAAQLRGCGEVCVRELLQRRACRQLPRDLARTGLSSE